MRGMVGEEIGKSARRRPNRGATVVYCVGLEIMSEGLTRTRRRFMSLANTCKVILNSYYCVTSLLLSTVQVKFLGRQNWVSAEVADLNSDPAMTTTMSVSASKPEIYTIFCIINGDDIPFHVDIESNETVGHLKDKIKEKKANRLRTVDAKDLKLYQTEVPVDDATEENVKQIMSKGQSPLDTMTKELGELFGATPPKKRIHIIVQTPTSGELYNGITP